MPRFIAALVCSLALATATIASAASVPWKTFTEAVPDATGNGFSACQVTGGVEEVFVQRYEKDGNAYQFWFSPTTYMMVFAIFEGNVDGAKADTIGVGKVNPYEHKDFPKMQWMTYEEAMARYPSGPCSALFPEQA